MSIQFDFGEQLNMRRSTYWATIFRLMHRLDWAITPPWSVHLKREGNDLDNPVHLTFHISRIPHTALAATENVGALFNLGKNPISYDVC